MRRSSTTYAGDAMCVASIVFVALMTMGVAYLLTF